MKVLPRFKKKINCVYQNTGKLTDQLELNSIYVWEQASPDLIERVFKDVPKKKDALKKLLNEGAKGVIIFDGLQWVAHGFISPPGVALPEHLPIKVVKNHWWLFYMHTRESYRGRGLQKLCTRIRMQIINKNRKNHEQIFTDIGLNNIASRRCFIRNRFAEKGLIVNYNLYLPKVRPITIWFRWDKNKAHPKLL